MNVPSVPNPDKYVGLYVVDFGDSSSVGFTAREVGQLLESEKFKDITVYKIHRAFADGRMELKGVPNETFQLETGMFFYSNDADGARGDFERLVKLSEAAGAPAMAKIHLAKYSDSSFVTALIYPAEYDDEFSQWLIDCDYKTDGQAAGGISTVQAYYDQGPEILRRHQIFDQQAHADRTREELLASVKMAVQR
jgi:hypothetical protein